MTEQESVQVADAPERSRFEITVDGRLRYSKKATGAFPTDDEVLGTVG